VSGQLSFRWAGQRASLSGSWRYLHEGPLEQDPTPGEGERLHSQIITQTNNKNFKQKRGDKEEGRNGGALGYQFL